MRHTDPDSPNPFAACRVDRRKLLAGAAASLAAAEAARAQTGTAPGPAAAAGRPTEFQIACMTYVYRSFPLQRALEGIARSGYRYVAWGTEHLEEGGRRVPVMAAEAPAAEARKLGQRCRDLGLTPLMLFSMVYPEHKNAPDLLKRRIEQAHAAGMPQVLTFGHTENGALPLWMERFRVLGPLARAAGVTLVVKQHGGETGTGTACARITRELNDDGIRVNFDAGNVMDYLNVDPIPDLKACADQVRSFCIKDHRNFPRDEDCGPGFGEIDHYRLLHPVAFTGRKMPLCCENIFAPLVPRPAAPEGVDALARRAREYLEVVVQGIQSPGVR